MLMGWRRKRNDIETSDNCRGKPLDSEEGHLLHKLEQLALDRNTNSSFVITDTVREKTWHAVGARGSSLLTASILSMEEEIRIIK